MIANRAHKLANVKLGRICIITVKRFISTLGTSDCSSKLRRLNCPSKMQISIRLPLPALSSVERSEFSYVTTLRQMKFDGKVVSEFVFIMRNSVTLVRSFLWTMTMVISYGLQLRNPMQFQFWYATALAVTTRRIIARLRFHLCTRRIVDKQNNYRPLIELIPCLAFFTWRNDHYQRILRWGPFDR